MFLRLVLLFSHWDFVFCERHGVKKTGTGTGGKTVWYSDTLEKQTQVH